jgi:hypothetical protein
MENNPSSICIWGTEYSLPWNKLLSFYLLLGCKIKWLDLGGRLFVQFFFLCRERKDRALGESTCCSNDTPHIAQLFLIISEKLTTFIRTHVYLFKEANSLIILKYNTKVMLFFLAIFPKLRVRPSLAGSL